MITNAFPAADRAHLALLAAPIAGLGTITVAVTYRGEHAVAAAALAEAIAAVVQPLVLALLCVPVAGGLAAALAGALRATSAGGAACGLVLLVTGVLAGYLAAGAVRLQALGQARTVTAVHAALITTSVRWALVAAAVSVVAALVLACTPGRKSS